MAVGPRVASFRDVLVRARGRFRCASELAQAVLTAAEAAKVKADQEQADALMVAKEAADKEDQPDCSRFRGPRLDIWIQSDHLRCIGINRISPCTQSQ